MSGGRLPFEYEVDDDARAVTSWGGLPLVSEVLTALGVDDAAKRYIRMGRGRREFDSAALIRAFVLMMAAGGDCLDDIGMLREDAALSRLLGARLPSAETLRHFLYDFHEDRLVEAAADTASSSGAKSFVPEESERLKGLGQVAAAFVAEIARRWPMTTATLDIDATLQESRKREAKSHFEGGRGYQPVVVTWAEADLIVADEFRDGNVPAHKDPLGVLKRAFAAVPSSVKHRLMRGDSALCSDEVLEFLCAESIEFAIGGETSKSFKAACEAVPADGWTKVEDRSDGEVHVAEVPATTAMLQRHPVRVIAVRLQRQQGQGELFDDDAKPLFLSVVTNRKLPAAELVRWYWAKAGTIEHVHGVVKNELGGGVLPCGRFGANAAWLRLVTLTYNVLRVVRLTGPEDLREARPKRLRLNLFALPTTVASHARRLIARVANRLQRAGALLSARTSLWSFPQPA